jgi:hypothetical protein
MLDFIKRLVSYLGNEKPLADRWGLLYNLGMAMVASQVQLSPSTFWRPFIAQSISSACPPLL